MMIFLVLCAFVCLLVRPVWGQALNAYCDPTLAELNCNAVPRYSNNNSIIYNGPTGNPALPWVIGKNDIVTLAAGSYTVGNGMRFGIIAIPAIYIIENGTLYISDTGANEVDFGADIYLCGNGKFVASESTLRINNLFPFQYFLWAAGTSQIIYQGLTVATIAKSVLSSNPNVGGVFGLHWMRGNSTLIIQKGKNGYGINSLRFGADNLEAGAFDNATIIAENINLMGETYIASQGTLSIADSQYLDVFFEACPGTPITFANLPDLCDLSLQNTSYACLTPQQPNISFSMAPPLSSFTVTIVNSKIFSWAVSSFPGSIIHLEDIAQNANLFVGLNINRICADRDCTQVNQSSFDILVAPGTGNYFGLDNTRTMTFSNAYVYGYHAWVGNNVTLNIQTGSQVGDILPNAGSFITATSTIASYGMVQISDGTVLVLNSCVIGESVLVNNGATIAATGTAFSSTPTVFSNAFFASCYFGQGEPILVGDAAVASFVNISSVTIINNYLVVVGLANAVKANAQPLSPYPYAVIEIVPIAGGAPVYVINITSPVFSASTLANTSISKFPGGNYTVKLHFNFANSALAVSTQNISIASTTTTSSIASSSSSALSSSSSSSSSASLSSTTTATPSSTGQTSSSSTNAATTKSATSSGSTTNSPTTSPTNSPTSSNSASTGSPNQTTSEAFKISSWTSLFIVAIVVLNL